MKDLTKREYFAAMEKSANKILNQRTINMKTGIELIAQERKEQPTKHGRTTEQDVEINRNYELAEAGRNLVWIEEEEKCGEPSTWDL